MSDEWLESEIDVCVRTYLWMRDAADKGYKPKKKRVREALIEGPMAKRSHGSIEYRFQNISAVLASRDEKWIEGYKPAKNVGSATSSMDATVSLETMKIVNALSPLGDLNDSSSV